MNLGANIREIQTINADLKFEKWHLYGNKNSIILHSYIDVLIHQIKI